MKFKFAFILAALLVAASRLAPGYADDQKNPPLTGGIEKHKHHGVHKVPAAPAVVPGSVHRIQIQQPPKDDSNPFQSMSQSLPAAAVKEELRRKNELPSAQTAILTPGAKINPGQSPSATMPSGTTGASPRILTPSGQAITKPGTSTYTK